MKLLGDERVSAYRNINLIMMSYTNAGSTFRRSLFINWGDGGKVFQDVPGISSAARVWLCDQGGVTAGILASIFCLCGRIGYF